jgi:hypothetical protein
MMPDGNRDVDDRAGRWPIVVVWLHALTFGMLAGACYLSPETPFGDAAWLPLPRLAVLLLAAALAAMAVALAWTAWSASPQPIGVLLLAVLTFDAQAPVFLFSQPAALEYFERAFGAPPLLAPLFFLVMTATAMHAALSTRRKASRMTRQRA